MAWKISPGIGLHPHSVALFPLLLTYIHAPCLSPALALSVFLSILGVVFPCTNADSQMYYC